MLKIMSLLCLVGVLTGCANINFEKINDSNRDSASGLRFWRPAPFLVIASDKDGHCTAKLIYMKDVNEEYAAQPVAGFGSITFKPTLTDGWNLTALDTVIDSKTSDFLGTIGKLPGLSETPAAPSGNSFSPSLGPGIYRIKMDQKTGGLELNTDKSVQFGGGGCKEIGEKTSSN